MAEVTIDDGRIARTKTAERVEYADGVIEAGTVEGVPPDVVYLRVQKEDDDLILFLRPDELAAMMFVGNAALWAAMMIERGGKS